eukprot:1198290-Amphidinium_carterae.5
MTSIVASHFGTDAVRIRSVTDEKENSLSIARLADGAARLATRDAPFGLALLGSNRAQGCAVSSEQVTGHRVGSELFKTWLSAREVRRDYISALGAPALVTPSTSKTHVLVCDDLVLFTSSSFGGLWMCRLFRANSGCIAESEL